MKTTRPAPAPKAPVSPLQKAEDALPVLDGPDVAAATAAVSISGANASAPAAQDTFGRAVSESRSHVKSLADGAAPPAAIGQTATVPMSEAAQAALAHILGPHAPSASGAESIAAALAQTPDTVLANLITERFSALEAEALRGPMPRLSVGAHFVDIGRLVPGQMRISLQRVREKVAKQVKYDGFALSDGRATPAFADGDATVPLSVTKTAVAAPGGRVLVTDGNHQAVASILAGAKKVPIEIVADHQDMTAEAFEQLAEEKGWVYLKDFGGAAATSAASYKSLKDDPLRFLFTQTALKAARGDDGDIVFEAETPAAERVWMKLDGRTADFVEFKLADVLYRSAEADPFLAEVLASGSLAEKARASRRALSVAVKAGELDPSALGIVLLDGKASLSMLRSEAQGHFA